MHNFLTVLPAKYMQGGVFVIPSSKPETQRALVTAALAEGRSHIYNDLRCRETEATRNGLRALGARIEEFDGRLDIHGVAGRPMCHTDTIDCMGSGYAFRVFSVLAALTPGTITITGDSVLQKRIMAPLLETLEGVGASIEYLGKYGHAPIRIDSETLRTGSCIVPGHNCSQFTTALLLGLPLSAQPMELIVTGEIASASYVHQTLDAMARAGVSVGSEVPAHRYLIAPQQYRPFTVNIGGDFTSASYIVAIACLFEGEYILKNVSSASLQGERAIIAFAEETGLEVSFNAEEKTCVLVNRHGRPRGNFRFNVRNSPNILPTLAAIGAFVDGSLAIIGGSVTNHHKSPRIRAMLEELSKLGVAVAPLYAENGELDGLELQGRATYEGGCELSSWGDHRIFLSLFIVSLRTRMGNQIEGYEGIVNSFPDFLDQVATFGVSFHVEKSATVTA